MITNKNLWDITNRPSTKTKLEILEQVFDIWLTIWNKQKWVSDEWYIIDLFAGTGKYIDKNDEVDGSPLIFLQKISNKLNTFSRKIKFKLFFVEKNKNNFNELKNSCKEFISNSPQIKEVINIQYFCDDCNEVIVNILSQVVNDSKHPIFILIDPTGLQIKKNTIKRIVKLYNPKDIMFNYILEGVRRTVGIAKKAHRGEELTKREITTVKTLRDFIGQNIDVVNQNDQEILEEFCSIFTHKNFKVVGYDVRYPDRNDLLYYLLFASKNPNVSNVVKDIYARQKEKNLGPTLFGGKTFYINTILTVAPVFQLIKRRTLLYKTKVEYGNWTINHIIGCKHGCRFPCYAMMMAKKFGWVKDYEDWRKPRIAENALELLYKEIPKYKDKIDFVHLCFMSDPFMYDFEKQSLVPEIKDMTLEIIEVLNKEGIKVTTLTKGIYPDELLDTKRFSLKNEYGITLVSLNNEFKNKFEPYSAPYKARLSSLKKLSDNGFKTWVSMEPYPTPHLDNQAGNIKSILKKISFVDKIIFGKLNYRRVSDFNNSFGRMWKNNNDFYKSMAKEIISFCEKRSIRYHIKFGTPLSKNTTINIFKD